MVRYSERITAILTLLVILAGSSALAGCMTTTVSSRSGFEVPTAGPETRGIVRMLFAGDIQPAIRILPHYPDKEFRRGKEGRVVIEFTILSNGQVGLLRLIESSGESFAEAAGQSMSSVLFQPRYAGQVIRVEVQFMILRTDTSD